MSWHTDTHWWRLSSWTWNHLTSPWTKQATWLGIAHSGDWCLHLALCTYSVAGQKWMNEWMTDRECWTWTFVTSDATCCVNRWLWLQQVGRSIGNFCASTLWRYSISVMFVVHVCIRNIIHTISLHVFGWLARDSMLSALYAIARPSVRLSVTLYMYLADFQQTSSIAALWDRNECRVKKKLGQKVRVWGRGWITYIQKVTLPAEYNTRCPTSNL